MAVRRPQGRARNADPMIASFLQMPGGFTMQRSFVGRIGAALASLILITAAAGLPLAHPVRAATTYTALTIDGESGAPVGGGVPQVFTDADSTFATGDNFLSTTPGYVLLIVNGSSGAAVGHWYYVHLAAPPGQDLAVGTYTGAVRAAFRGAGQPGIDVYGDGVGCNEVAGQFTVQEISFTASALTAFSATYSFTCDAQAPRVSGEVRYHSTQPFAGLRQLPDDPHALDFGFSNIVGVPSAPRATQLVNLGTTTIALSAYGVDGANPSDYSQTSRTCGASLAPGASCGWNTTFKATVSGYRYATAHYTSDTYGFVHGQTLAGFADPAAPHLQITPTSKAFGNIAIGLSVSQAFKVTSDGNVPVTMGARSITGPNAAD